MSPTASCSLEQSLTQSVDTFTSSNSVNFELTSFKNSKMTSTLTSDGVNQLDHVAASSLNANVKFRKASSSSKDFSVSTSSSNKELELLNVANLDLGSFEAQVTSSGQSGPPKEVDSPRLYLLYGIVILHMTIFATELLVDFMTHSVLILTDCYHHLFNACNALLLVVSFRVRNFEI